MLAGLKKMFGEQVIQKGSNITPERLRFDFNLDHKMTEDEIKELEVLIKNANSVTGSVTTTTTTETEE